MAWTRLESPAEDYDAGIGRARDSPCVVPGRSATHDETRGEDGKRNAHTQIVPDRAGRKTAALCDSRNLRYDPATMWQAYVRFRSGSTTRADVAENEDDARKALDEAMNQLKSNGIGTVGPSLVVTKDDLEFIKLEQKQAQDAR